MRESPLHKTQPSEVYGEMKGIPTVLAFVSTNKIQTSRHSEIYLCVSCNVIKLITV